MLRKNKSPIRQLKFNLNSQLKMEIRSFRGSTMTHRISRDSQLPVSVLSSALQPEQLKKTIGKQQQTEEERNVEDTIADTSPTFLHHDDCIDIRLPGMKKSQETTIIHS